MRNSTKSAIFKIAPICFATWASLGYILPAHSSLIVDIHQKDVPGIHANINGSVTVDINKPSSNGISHNKFVQFDVNKPGMVLNNNKGTNAVNTTVVGKDHNLSIGQNKNLTNGSASLIINEVTSGRISQLKGQIEVAGDKADVIVANPAGISCDGCGFVNTKNGTLTTGTPNIVNGEFQGLDVQKGRITITGQNMVDKSDYTNIIANALQVNGDINAENELRVFTGNNTNVAISDDGVTGPGKARSNYSTVGIDVAKLGGMHANKITLFADKNINNKGIIVSKTALNISGDGNLINSGSIQTRAENTPSPVDSSLIVAVKNITNTGVIASTGNIELLSNSIKNNKGLIVADNDNTVYMNADLVDNYAGRITADNITILANNVNNTNSASYIKQMRDSSTGGIHARNDLAIFANNKINNNKGLMSSTNSDVYVFANEKIDNAYGRISSQGGNVNLQSDKNIVLDHSYVTAGKDINISAYSLDKYSYSPVLADAHITADKDINFTVSNLGKFDNQTVINAKENINFNAVGDSATGTFRNYGVLNAGVDINFEHNDLENDGVIKAGNDFNINKAKTVRNYNTISAFNNINIQNVNSFRNEKGATTTAFTGVNINSLGDVVNNGMLISPEMHITTGKYSGYGKTIGHENITVTGHPIMPFSPWVYVGK